MENNIQAVARQKRNRILLRLSTWDTAKRYHGYRCGVARIIESRAVADKRLLEGRADCRGVGMRNGNRNTLWPAEALPAGVFAAKTARPNARSIDAPSFPAHTHKGLDTVTSKTVSGFLVRRNAA